mgnify:CR=1 FL=1
MKQVCNAGQRKRAQIIEKLTKEGEEGPIPDLTKSPNSFIRGVVNILGGVLQLGVASPGAGPVVEAVVGGIGSKPLTYYLVPKKKKDLQDAIVRTEEWAVQRNIVDEKSR